mmetsp:Transcript_5796/g.12106  ORF Transcript_5796/g.12106 Transcript_5796/m.12106 type:complete len:782 (-) Transcript_5796:387-2732(-)|eukprot:CAMPEP_0183290728 /NCGR_PEP_ID=MMETSP0160_2-20130417/345_1 /TAXON_ID=2839 ORGANISM="Odontella Sinensis, Strain Grunow 1884" /NCGR_SAMPLE_ID=MMETSP0160_2 /ASSEMBLY_ACC=CAM_ASM_000250 /LENGTH=781 /DNA_ID=CAMNT_0025451381 /DNA_START=200 /DNA_END=2545 /DNA_ORIENTATION=+
MSKRMGGGLGGLLNKKARSDEKAAADGAASRRQEAEQRSQNPYLNRPANPEEALKIFLVQARAAARRVAGGNLPATEHFVEIEARIGTLKSPFGLHDMRLASSGPKRVSFGGKMGVANAFVVAMGDPSSQPANPPRPHFMGGITRSHCTLWTGAGLAEASPVSAAFGVRASGGSGSESERIRKELVEKELVETVYGGYSGDNRVCFPGDHHAGRSSTRGKMEHKAKVTGMDVCLPAAPYDLRLTLATEKAVDNNVMEPPSGWKTKRLKRRRSYTRRDGSFAWQLDVTEVTAKNDSTGHTDVSYEIEMELNQPTTLKLVNENDDAAAQKLCKQLAQQLWWMLGQINPIHDVLDAEELLREHPDNAAVKLALAQCGALKKFMQSKGTDWRSPISADGNSPPPPAELCNMKFIGCMPVNFQRHNLEEVQRSEENGYFCSEKTDGVRYLMVFTGKTVVLVDRSMKGKQPLPVAGDTSGADPMSPVLSLIKPGTVLDGEVVMHRKLRRPIFIVFDVMAISTERPVLQLPFGQRLRHLHQATFRTETANRDMFAPALVGDKRVALPLVRKNFVKRTQLDNLLSNVSEEKGHRTYRHGDTHHHLTDGIIFQPNLPYVCGTDHNLMKWKYLDTVTIDVEILPPKPHFRQREGEDEDVLRVGVVGDEGSTVDMTRFIKLPPSERHRLEADRAENGAKIVEVGFEPTTGEWYYLTTRPDKVASNHISTVIGTLLELAESLSTEELRYRMSVPPGSRDTYRKDMGGMQKQLLEHQRQKNKATAARSAANGGR